MTLNQLARQMVKLLGDDPNLMDIPMSELIVISKEEYRFLNTWAPSHNPLSPTPSRSSDPPIPADCTKKRVQDAAVQQLITESETTTRTLFLKFKQPPLHTDEFMSSAIGAKIESLFWNSDHRFGFINFTTHNDAHAFLTYWAHHQGFHIYSEIEMSWTDQKRPMDRPIAEAIVMNGATRILRVNRVPVSFGYRDAWKVVSRGGCKFRFVHPLREDLISRDFAMEFDGVANAVWAREVLFTLAVLHECGFVWVGNDVDRAVEEYNEALNGVMPIYPIE